MEELGQKDEKKSSWVNHVIKTIESFVLIDLSLLLLLDCEGNTA